MVNGYGEYRKVKVSSHVPPPPTIWNANTALKDIPIIPSRRYLETISEREKYDDYCKPGGRSSRNAIAFQSHTIYETPLSRKEPLRREYQNDGRCATITNINSRLRCEHAVIIIQRAYRRYRRRMRLRSQMQNKRQSITSPTLSGKSQRSARHSAHQSRRQRDGEKYSGGYSKSILLKDYLKEGSLFFEDRESVIVFGGIDPHSKYGDGRNTGRNIFRYHSEINQWDLVGELPQPRHHHAVAFLKGRIYLAGGTDPRDDEKGKTVVVGTVWSFEPITRAWYKETEMQTPRKNFGLVVMNGKLLAIGGQDKDGRIIKSVERYDIQTGVWEYLAPLNVERTGAAATKYRDTVWVAGGMTASRKNPLTYSVESYDPKLNIWVQQAPLRFPRCFGCLFSMNDVLYLIGGAGRASEKERTTSSCNAIDVWNPKEEEWKLHFAMSIPRHGHAVAYLGTQILIIGGVTTAYLRALTDIECFCCERKTWVKGLANLPVPLSGHGAVTLPPASLI